VLLGGNNLSQSRHGHGARTDNCRQATVARPTKAADSISPTMSKRLRLVQLSISDCIQSHQPLKLSSTTSRLAIRGVFLVCLSRKPSGQTLVAVDCLCLHAGRFRHAFCRSGQSAHRAGGFTAFWLPGAQIEFYDRGLAHTGAARNYHILSTLARRGWPQPDWRQASVCLFLNSKEVLCPIQ